ncbi:Fic family protein [Halomonas elongata]|uniref:Fic family protein n=1 Tax=Halomonas elongata TaxID=2746 RepID=UPI0038D46940
MGMHTALMTSGRGIDRGPGEFRGNQVWLGGHRADEAVFVLAPPHHLAECWSALERFINDVSEATDPLIKTALAHVQFETIHPFMDGNGRLGRLLIPLILVEAGILSEPLLYLSVFFKKYRQVYYERLQQVRVTGDWEAWLRFFVDAVADTATLAVSTARKLNELREKDKTRLAELGRQAGSAGLLLDALFQQPIANINHLCQHTGLTPATVGKLLTGLEAELGIVHEITGQKRNRIYAYRAYIDILNQEPA